MTIEEQSFNQSHTQTSSTESIPKEAAKVYEKRYQDGRVRKNPLIFKKIISNEIIHSYAYIAQELAKFRHQPLPICTDEEALIDLNKTFICLGGPTVNELTEWATKERSNKFLRFSPPDDTDETMVTIEVISNSKNYLAFGTKEGKDYGMILKVKNNRFPKHFFFVCAGIKIWGSWGAAWFLSQQWKNLYKEFGAEEFGVVVEVHRNIITSAIRVYP